MRQKKTVVPGKGSRNWLESFAVTEEKEGVHNYAVQLLPAVATANKFILEPDRRDL